MKLTLESTPTITTIDGVPVRLWEGVTQDGIPVKVFIHRIAVASDQDHAAFERELKDMGQPYEIRFLEDLLRKNGAGT